MFIVQRGRLPDNALLRRYADQKAYTDCYCSYGQGPAALSAFVLAFYTTPVFKLERWLLARFLSKPSTDQQARQVAEGTISEFSAWHVEARTRNQLLMCDLHGRTRSWFMVKPGAQDHSGETQLLFGSAVVPVRSQRTGRLALGFGFTALLGFHRLYSRVLLAAARRRLG